MIKATFDLENKLLFDGYQFIIGIDEAGRGPLAGPVVAAATLYRNYQIPISNDKDFIKSWDLVRDSKLLSAKQREKIFDFIQENFYCGIGICDHKTIDRMNILGASFLAMKKAIVSLTREISNGQFPISNKIPNSNSQNTIILVDGNKKIPNFSMEQQAIVNGDKIVKSISAASIIAKVTRDRRMMSMHDKYPNYGFDKHKGYGTKLHMEMLKLHGPCEIHRKSFEPVTSLLKKR